MNSNYYKPYLFKMDGINYKDNKEQIDIILHKFSQNIKEMD